MMLKNFFKVAFRNLLRDKSNATINIFGLSTAFLCCIIVFVFVRQELTYDSHHKNTDHIYRITIEEINRPGARYFATSSPPMGPALVESFPEIKQSLRFWFADRIILEYENQRFYEDDIAYADSSFFSIFDFALSKGNSKTALNAINSIVLTHEMARKYFGDENPLGKSLILDNSKSLTVTGVLEPITNKTHLNFDALISFDSFEVPMGFPVTLESWGWVSFYTYVLLEEGANITKLEQQFQNFLIQNTGEVFGQNRLLRLQPLNEIYFNSSLLNAGLDMRTGNIDYIYGMSAIGVFLLIIACFNFMNLTTTHTMRRRKEVGVRKSLGANRGSLFWQFIGESLLISFISVSIALCLLEPFAGYISSLLRLQLTILPGDYIIIIAVFTGAGAVVGILAGIWPAIVISRAELSSALRGSFKQVKSGFDIRATLIVAQFTIAIFLIAGSIFIFRQIGFIQNTDLGFQQEQILVLHMDGSELTRRYHTIKEQIEQNPHVVSAAIGSGLLDGNNGTAPIFTEEIEDPSGYAMNVLGVHFGFFETMQIKFKEGRPFDEAFSTDLTNGIVVNEAAVRAFGWEDPLGKELRAYNFKDGHVIGVTEDFHFASLHQEIKPLVMYIPPTNMDKLFVRVRPGAMDQMLVSIEQTWKEIVPDFPLQLVFLDEHLNSLYQTDQRFFRLITIFTILTIIIACLGLYGLISFFIQQRTKEIGIRKILGASIAQITFLLSKKFLLLVVIANLIAWPLTWYIINQWLQNFAYRIELSLEVLIVSGLVAIVVACMTLSYRSIKAALMNPVESLRSE